MPFVVFLTERKHTHGMTVVTQTPWFFGALFVLCACGPKGASEPSRAEKEAKLGSEVDVFRSAEEKKKPDVATEPPSVPRKPPSALPCPQTSARLDVEGFAPASFVCPDGALKKPMPVFVVLHGNYDRPEWQCDTWKEAAGHLGFILCPRGVPSDPQNDRWTYAGRKAANEEMLAAFAALKNKYPDHVRASGNVYVGFSLGAIYGTGLVFQNSGLFDGVILVEGGLKRLNRRMLKRLEKSGVESLVLAMGVPSRRRRAAKIVSRARKKGLDAHYVDMPGAGHGYSGDFAERARKVLKSSKIGDKEIP